MNPSIVLGGPGAGVNLIARRQALWALTILPRALMLKYTTQSQDVELYIMVQKKYFSFSYAASVVSLIHGFPQFSENPHIRENL
jgi:hypothetical protein